MVDVIIPTYKPNGELAVILDMLSRQTLKPDKIIIINTEKKYMDEFMKEPERRDALKSAEIHHIGRDEFDHGATRNMGAAYSKADIMIFMTQDAIPCDDSFVEKLLTPFADEKIALSYARQLPKAGSTEEERLAREFNYPDAPAVKSAKDRDRLGIKTYFCSNVSCAYRRSIFDELGGFVGKTIFNEDMIYAAAVVGAGYSIAYAADAKVYHSHSYTPAMQFHRNVDIGISQAEHPEVFGGLSSESEGKRFVTETIGKLIKGGHSGRVPVYIWSVICRYAGFLIGKNYRIFPKAFIKKCSMSPEYFGG